MTTLLAAHIPGSPAYYVIDGRHRLSAAVAVGVVEMRCDVVTRSGTRSLQIIPVDQLAIDPDVQIDFAYNDRRARKMAMKWDLRKCDPLLVVPIADRMAVETRADLKLGTDRERRRVTALESFMAEVKQGSPAAVAIDSIVQETGWKIGPTQRGKSPGNIQSVAILSHVHESLGPDVLRRALGIAARWRGDNRANSAVWIGAWALLVRDGYDHAISAAAWNRLDEIAPAVVIRRAEGALGAVKSSGSAHGMTAIHYEVASYLRKAARLKQRPLVRPNARASQSRAIQ